MSGVCTARLVRWHAADSQHGDSTDVHVNSNNPLGHDYCPTESGDNVTFSIKKKITLEEKKKNKRE